MIKAVFFDVDGTILSHKSKSVPQSALGALATLKAAGIRCVVATGRPDLRRLHHHERPADPGR